MGSCKANTSGHCPPGPRQLRGMDSHPPWAQLQVPILTACTTKVVWAGHVPFPSLGKGGPGSPLVRTHWSHLLALSYKLGGQQGAGEAGAKDTISTDEEDDEVNTD